jgi:enoyl-CoA hydratase
MTALDDAIGELAARDDLVAVLLTGAGDTSFCAGGDLRWLQRFKTPESGAEMSRRMQAILIRLSRLPVPVIGVLNGYALGGGTEIAMACDLRIVEQHAVFQFKQARVGVMSGWGGGARLLHLVGYARAFELFCSCRPVDAAEAATLGLAQRVVPKGHGLDAAREFAEQIRLGSGRSLGAIKRLLQGAIDLDIQRAAALEARLFAEVWSSPEHREAVAAFFERRPPRLR